MKKFLFLLVWFPLITYGQEVPKEYRKMKTIVVSPTLPSEDWLKEIGNIMIDEGFEIEKLDREFNLINTSPKNISGLDWQIRVRIKNNLAEITHYGRNNIYSNQNTGSPLIQMDFSAGMNKSPLRQASDGVYQFAKKIGDIVNWIE